MFIMDPVEEAKIGSDQSIRPAKTWGLPRAVEFGQNVRGGGGARVAKCQIFYTEQIFESKIYPKKSA